MENLPSYVYASFGFTVICGLWLFWKASNYSKRFFYGFAGLLLVQSILGVFGFYNHPQTMAMRVTLLVLPSVLYLFRSFTTKNGKAFIDSFDLPTLTILHVVRIPVEVVLLWLFLNGSVPEAMTFEGRNFDILSGLSAPLVYYFGFAKRKLSTTVVLIWNIICLALLLNVVANGLLSLPGRYQQFGFEQPNIALGYFPFLLLPSCLVPLVAFSSAVSIRKLLLKENISKVKLSS